MSKNKKYWKNLAELNSDNNDVFDKLQNKEFVEEIPVDEFLSDKDNLTDSSTSRRDFLKYIGFSTAAATLAACEGPVVKSIPYVVQPKEIIPGVANYYATTIGNGYDFANILIKNREGRPIKVEKNSLAPVENAANARVHASILDLYDNARLAQPTKDNMPISWFGFEYETKAVLQEISKSNKDIVLLTQTFASPSRAFDSEIESYTTCLTFLYLALTFANFFSSFSILAEVSSFRSILRSSSLLIIVFLRKATLTGKESSVNFQELKKTISTFSKSSALKTSVPVLPSVPLAVILA